MLRSACARISTRPRRATPFALLARRGFGSSSVTVFNTGAVAGATTHAIHPQYIKPFPGASRTRPDDPYIEQPSMFWTFLFYFIPLQTMVVFAWHVMGGAESVGQPFPWHANFWDPEGRGQHPVLRHIFFDMWEHQEESKVLE